MFPMVLDDLGKIVCIMDYSNIPTLKTFLSLLEAANNKNKNSLTPEMAHGLFSTVIKLKNIGLVNNGPPSSNHYTVANVLHRIHTIFPAMFDINIVRNIIPNLR